MTPEQIDARTRGLVSAARALLSLQVGLYVGARRIDNALSRLGPQWLAKHRIFSQFADAVPHDIPVGTARLFWAPEVVLATDRRLASVEARFRPHLLKECIQIVRDYGKELS